MFSLILNLLKKRFSKGNSKFFFSLLRVGAFFSDGLLLMAIGGIIIVAANFSQGMGAVEQTNCVQAQADTNSDVSSNDTVSSDMAANAQKIFDNLTKKEGFSGIGAAAAIGWMQGESSLNPAALNPSGGVAGIAQWSGFSSTINGSRIEAGGFIRPGNVSDLTLDNELKLMDYELEGSKKYVLKSVGDAKDIDTATSNWCVDYEGVLKSDNQYISAISQRQQWAKEWNDKLNKDNVPSHIKEPSNSTDNNSTDNTTQLSDDNSSDCDTGANDEDNVQGGGISVLDKEVGQTVGSGECYALSAWWVNKLTNEKYSIGSGISGTRLGGSADAQYNAKDIGDLDWSVLPKWKVIKVPKYSQLKVGDIINFKSPEYPVDPTNGHTAIIKSIDGNGKITLYSQNPGPISILHWIFHEGGVTSVVQPDKIPN